MYNIYQIKKYDNKKIIKIKENLMVMTYPKHIW